MRGEFWFTFAKMSLYSPEATLSFTAPQRRSVVDRIRSLMSDLTAEADNRMQQLIESIHRNQASIEKMSKELAQPSSVSRK